MNTNITPKSPLFLSLSSLSEPCNELHNLINNPNSSRKERVEFEQNLWKRIQDVRELNEESLVTHFIGYYSKLLIQIGYKQATCDLLQYHIFIRLGDLNRYISQLKVAEIYYSNARNSFPLYGHAYNQLALLAGVKDIFRCCYYYARAAKSCEKPLKNIADSNLRIAVGKSDCELLNHILDNDLPIEDVLSSGDGERSPIRLPESASQWFYVMVVAIYSDNVQAIGKSYLHYMSENFSTQKVTTISSCNNKIQTIFCDRDSYILLACLDILLDWLRLGSQGQQLVALISASLRRIRSCLHATLLSMKLEPRLTEGNDLAATTRWFSQSTNSKSNNTTHSSTGMTNDTSCSTLQDSSTTTHINSSSSSSSESHVLSFAFPHDHVLRGFKPLECVHKQLAFVTTTTTADKPKLTGSQFLDAHGPGQKFIESIQLMQLLSRIRFKIESLGPLVKKRSRNIALESILTNMTAGVNGD